MPPKRKYQESTTIVYGTDVPWLQPLPSGSDDPTNPNPSPVRSNPSISTPAEDIVWESAKLAYILYHKLDVNANLSHALEYIGVNSDTPEHKAWTKKIACKQTQWKGTILNKILLDHVKELVRKWHIANAYKSFNVLDEEERRDIWMKEYDRDPKRTINTIFKPVIGVVDITNVFNTDLATEEDRVKMSAVRVMLRNKYLYGCEITFQHRVLVDKSDACAREWVAYSDMEGFSETIVPIASVPISFHVPPAQPASDAKKQKLETEPQVSESSDVIV